MLILIAESKTMAPCRDDVSAEEYASHRPCLENSADGIMESLRGADTATLATKVKISAAMAARLRDMIYEFPDKSKGGKAIEAYTGVVFKALDYKTLDADAREVLGRDVRIISSLYGWLRPDDCVKPYRFDFTTALAPGGLTLAAYMRDAVTECLIDELRRNSCREVLNLLPGDACRCIDMARVEQCADVCRADFREMQPGGGFKTPNSNRLKTLRGKLLRQIVTENIADFDTLKHLSSNDYMADGVSDGGITFATVAG